MNEKAYNFLMSHFGKGEDWAKQFEAEDFNADEFKEAFEREQIELFEAKHLKSYEERFKREGSAEALKNIVKPLSNRLKQSGVYGEDFKEPENYDELKETLDKLSIVYNKAIEGKKDVSVSELEKRLLEAQTQIEEITAKKDGRISELVKEVENSKLNYELKLKLGEASRMLDKRLRDKEVVTFDSDDKIGYYGDRIKDEILSNYSVDPATGEVKAKDGTTKAMKPDQKSFYKNVNEIIRDIAERDNLIKRSNGGNRSAMGGKIVTNQKGEQVNYERSNALANWIASQNN